ncbi:MAG: DUF523 domain-containing protein [Deltaproteobacteria bacterium]|nr:DUF523 domain-containing protein [Deltaproteobacteria bacterium]
MIVSACLIGLKTRYDGSHSLDKKLVKFLKDKPFIPLCPEQLGGLPTPRPKSEIVKGNGVDVIAGRSRVRDEYGRDVTTAFIRGAQEVLRIAKYCGAREAVLKEKSPSCGVRFIKRNGRTLKGAGVTTATLKKAGIKVKGAG